MGANAKVFAGATSKNNGLYKSVASGSGDEGGDDTLLAMTAWPPGRELLTTEIRIAMSVFGYDIDYSEVLVFNRGWYPGQPVGTIIAPDGNIYYPSGNEHYEENFLYGSLVDQAIFMHEMTHVWQHQQLGSIKVRGIVSNLFSDGEYLPLDPAKPFESYNIEEQAGMVQDYYVILEGGERPELPSKEEYERILPFSGIEK